MYVKSEEAQAVVIELSASEAAHIAADLDGKLGRVGKEAEALMTLLRDNGFFRKLAVSQRTEWAGPDK